MHINAQLMFVCDSVLSPLSCSCFKMSSSYKLLYFDLRVVGVGEPIRLMFAYAGVPYEDKSITFEEWPAIKPTTPLGSLPILYVNGKTLTQSTAIARFVGNECGLVPKDSFQAARCDEVMNMLNDIVTEWRPMFLEKDADVKAKKKAALLNHIVPSLRRLEGFVKENGNEHVVPGGKLVWADLALAHYLEMLEHTVDDNLLLKGYPALKEFQRKIFSIPSIKDYREKRPNAIA